MRKHLLYPVLALALTAEAHAVMNGQILNCDTPNPSQPQNCVDNWALDLLDESKTAIQTAPGALPRDRKHYFDGTGAGVHIFMMDTGIDGNNPDFKTLDAPGTSRLGVTYGSMLNVDGDSGSHGTRTAAIAAGLKYGVAKGATLHQVRTSGYINNTGGDQILDRLNWIYDQVVNQGMRPAVLNMSFNIPRPVMNGTGVNVEAQITQRVRDLINQRVVVTVSAGNHNSGSPGNYWPSVISEVILVGGVDENGDRWVRDAGDPDYNNICLNPLIQDCGSNWGPLVDIWAPAKYIRSAVRINNDDVNAPRVRSGTSFAAPIVAGLAALYLEQNPLATAAQVRTALIVNAADIGDFDSTGATNYLARSPVATPACNVTQRLFVNSTKSVPFYSTDLKDSCPAGYDASAQLSASNGTIAIGGIAPGSVLYNYTPNVGFTGLDQFSYTIYNSTGGVFGTGTGKITVQPNHN